MSAAHSPGAARSPQILPKAPNQAIIDVCHGELDHRFLLPDYSQSRFLKMT